MGRLRIVNETGKAYDTKLILPNGRNLTELVDVVGVNIKIRGGITEAAVILECVDVDVAANVLGVQPPPQDEGRVLQVKDIV